MRYLISVVIFTLLLTAPASALDFGPYMGRIVRTVDGDTVSVAMIVYPGLTVHEMLRLEGVDTPEMNGDCEREKRKAREAKQFVQQWVPESVRITVTKMDSFGRAIGSVKTPDGEDLGQVLLDEGLARPYGHDRTWCGNPA